MTEATKWTRYWQLGETSSCLPNAEKTRRRIFGHWNEVAEALVDKAHVLDLGCGSGTLAEHLVGQRKDISVTGVDFAQVEPSTVKRVTLLPGVDMGAMPLDDASVDMAVSMFGVEYGDPQQLGSELARVLKPGGSFSFIVHHADSPVVSANKARAATLRTLCDDKVGKALMDQDQDGLVRQMFDLRLAAGAQAPLVDTVARGLAKSFAKEPSEREADWHGFVESSAVECVIIEALEKAAVSDPRQWASQLGDQLLVKHPTFIATPRDERIAWVIEGQRA